MQTMHVVGVTDAMASGIAASVGAMCWITAFSIWKRRNGGIFTRGLCLVLAMKGVWGFGSAYMSLYLLATRIPVPAATYWPWVALNVSNALCWLYVLVFVLPRAR